MRIVLLASLAALLQGCPSSALEPKAEATSSSEVSEAKESVMTESEARVIAEQKAKESGYDASVYPLTSIRLLADGPRKDSWVASFTHVPPAAPGQHFSVYVRPTGESELVHGR